MTSLSRIVRTALHFVPVSVNSFLLQRCVSFSLQQLLLAAMNREREIPPGTLLI